MQHSLTLSYLTTFLLKNKSFQIIITTYTGKQIFKQKPGSYGSNYLKSKLAKKSKCFFFCETFMVSFEDKLPSVNEIVKCQQKVLV
jgi:hypothetical protein